MARADRCAASGARAALACSPHGAQRNAGATSLPDAAIPDCALRASSGLRPARLGAGSRTGVVDDLAQIGDVLGERAAAGRTHAHARLRLALLETLLDHDVARLLECLQMRAEIAVGRPDQRLEPRELDRPLLRRDRIERGHDLQPHALVNDLVGTAHCDTPLLPSQMPPTIKVPLSTAAIHKRSQGSDWR